MKEKERLGEVAGLRDICDICHIYGNDMAKFVSYSFNNHSFLEEARPQFFLEVEDIVLETVFVFDLAGPNIAPHVLKVDLL